jgi:hypothetical protein
MSFKPSINPVADSSVALTKLYRLHLMELANAEAAGTKSAKRSALARAQKLLTLYFALGNIDFPASL